MSTSPFKRRMNPSKTYSKRTSLPSTSRSKPVLNGNNASSDIAKLLMDSSEEEEQDMESGDSDEDIRMRLLGKNGKAGRSQRTDENQVDTSTGNLDSVKAKGKEVDGEQGDQRKASSRRSNPTRTKSASTVAEEDSTVWDEKVAITKIPAIRTRTRRSVERGTAPTTTTAESSPRKTSTTSPKKRPLLTSETSPRKSRRPSIPSASSTYVAQASPRAASPPSLDDSNLHSDPPSPPPRKRRIRPSTSVTNKRNSKEAEEEADDSVPPPFDYVPFASRLKSSPAKDHPSLEPITTSSAPAAKPLPETISAPLIRTILPSSSSPAKLPPRPASPLPSRTTSLKSPSISNQAKRPPSPAAKDLSSLFSSFSKTERTAPTENSGDETSSSSTRGGIKRATSGGVVASLIAKRAGDRDQRSRATTPIASPERPTRTTLDRSLSQPSFSSPLSSPNGITAFRSPQRPSLGAAASLPDLLSPSKSRSGSASPVKASNLNRSPALGSVYRPVSFSASASAAGYADGGKTRTYGGARSFRPEAEELTAESSVSTSKRPNLDLSASTSSSSHLPILPPSITQRITKPTLPQESYAQLREKWGVAAEEELDEDEEQESQERGARVMGTGILRAQGEGKRWSDEIGWTLDGLKEGKGGSGARSSALEILGKTIDRDWMRRLKSSGMAEQVYLAFRRGGAGDGDRVLDIALVVLLATLTRDQRLCEPLFRLTTSDVAGTSSGISRSPSTSRSSSTSPRKESVRNCEVLETLVELSKREWVTDEIGPAAKGKETKGKTSKNDARHLQSLREIIDKSEFSAVADLPVTLRALILQTINAISCFVARPIFQPQQLLCTTGAFEAVVDAFIEECRPLERRIEKYSTGLDLIPSTVNTTSPDIFSPATIAICLEIFESTSLSTPYAFQLVSSPLYLESLSRTFCDVTLAASILIADKANPDRAETSFKLLLSILGIIFGLATESIWSDALLAERASKSDGLVGILVRMALKCRQVSKSRSTSADKRSLLDDKEEDDEQRPEWDALCLVLGTLTNLLESTDEAKDKLRETLIASSCQSSRKCLRTCSCSSPQPALTTLTQFYLDPLDDAPNTVHRTSVTGFLRLLLGLSLLDDPRNETLVLDTLSSPSITPTPPENPLSAIIDALDEFAKLHEEQSKVRGMLQLENGQEEEEDEDSQTTTVTKRDDEDVTMEEVGRKGSRDAREEEDIVRKIRRTIQRLKRRMD